MHDLIDLFTPGELLHIVSIANQHGFLKTEHKRFLIALRMTGSWQDGVWEVDEEKKSRFAPILGQFLQELEPWQRCNKDECALCDRFQSLHADFHGAQESEEFRLFMDWFMKGSRTYQQNGASRSASPAPGTVAGSAPVSPEPVARIVPAAVVPASPALAPAPAAVSVPGGETPAMPAASPRPAPAASARPVALPRDEAGTRSWQAPLFTLNRSHPALSSLDRLANQNLGLMDDFQLRDFTQRLQKMAREFLDCLDGGMTTEWNPAEQDGKDGLRRIV